MGGRCLGTAGSSWLVGGSGRVELVLESSESVLTAGLSSREALLAEMGVAMREDGGTLGVFSPKKVGTESSASVDKVTLALVDIQWGVLGEGVVGWGSGPGMN